MPAFKKTWPGFAMVKFKCWAIDGQPDSVFQYCTQGVTKEMTENDSAIPTMLAREGYDEPFEFWKVEYLGEHERDFPVPFQVANWIRLFLPNFGVEARPGHHYRYRGQGQLQITLTAPTPPPPREYVIQSFDQFVEAFRSGGYHVFILDDVGTEASFSPSVERELAGGGPLNVNIRGTSRWYPIPRASLHENIREGRVIARERRDVRNQGFRHNYPLYDEYDAADANAFAIRTLQRMYEAPQFQTPPNVVPTFFWGVDIPPSLRATDENLDQREADGNEDRRDDGSSDAGSVPPSRTEGGIGGGDD